MSTNVITVSPQTPASEVAEILKANNIDALPVLVRDKLVGIIAHLDVATVPSVDRSKVLTQAIMSKDLVIAYPEESLHDALVKMTQKCISHLPVVKQNYPNQLIGIITVSDISYRYSLEADRMFEDTRG